MSILFKKALIILFVFTLFCLSLSGCTTKIPLSLQIDSPEDGAEFSVNVQKVSGVVSDPEATVRINDIEAKVDRDGAFYAYIDLTKGENTIEAGATRGNDTHSETITVSFSPELAVYSDLPPENESSLMLDWKIRKGALDGQKVLHTETDHQQAEGSGGSARSGSYTGCSLEEDWGERLHLLPLA